MKHDLTADRQEKFRRVADALGGGIGLEVTLQEVAARVAETGLEEDERQFWALVMTTPITLLPSMIEERIQRAIEGVAA